MAFDQNESDENDCSILKVYSKRDKRVPAYLANFSQGDISTDARNRLQFACFKKDTDALKVGNDAGRTLMANNGRLTFTGSSNPQNLQYFIGVRSRITGKTKLFDCALFRMKPDANKLRSAIQPAPATPKSYWEGVNELTENFGSKARKRALSARQKFSVDASLEETIQFQDTPMQSSPDRTIEGFTPQIIDYLPPQNRIATSVFDVFNIDDIISSEEDDYLSVEVEEWSCTPADVLVKKRFSLCRYVNEHLDGADPVKMKYLLYYNYLVTFQHLKYADLRKRDPAPGIPEPYKQNILKKFTLISRNDNGRDSRSCPSQMKDKIIAYIFVLALFIDDFIVNINQVTFDLNNVGQLKAVTIAQALGCHVGTRKIGEQDTKVAELKLPLFVLIPRNVRKTASKRP